MRNKRVKLFAAALLFMGSIVVGNKEVQAAQWSIIARAGGIRRMMEVIRLIHGNQLVESGIILMEMDIC